MKAVLPVVLAWLAACGSSAPPPENPIPDPSSSPDPRPLSPDPSSSPDPRPLSPDSSSSPDPRPPSPVSSPPLDIPLPSPEEIGAVSTLRVTERDPVTVAAPVAAGDGRLRIGRPELAVGGGRVNAGMLLREIESKKGGMLACYNIALGRDPELEGSLGLVMVIDTQGMVGVSVDADDEALAAAGVTSCVSEKLRSIDFEDHPPSSELRILVPLEFEP